MKVIHGCGIKWCLEHKGENEAIVTSIPDVSELDDVETEGDYLRFFDSCAQAVFQSITLSGYAIFCQTDKQSRGILDKSYHLTKTALALGFRVMFHKICLIRDINLSNNYKPTYSHLLCYSKKGTPGYATPDVFMRGKVLYPNGMGLDCCKMCLEFLQKKRITFVADPFVGQGTVLCVATKMGFDGIGVDVDSEQVKIARENILTYCLEEKQKDNLEYGPSIRQGQVSYIQGDIHDVIKDLPDDSVDLIYCDPPFGITKADWDKPLEWKELFPQMWRVLKRYGVIVLYASQPFTYELLKYETPRYHYSWHKDNSTGHLTAKKQPMRCMEEIFVYYHTDRYGRHTYNPQMVGDDICKEKRLIPNQGLGYYASSEGACSTETHSYDTGNIRKGRYPTTYQNWKIRREKEKQGITRTDEHIDYFIKTYTNLGAKVLDMTCHNTFVGKRCRELGRDYLGVDLLLNFNGTVADD